MSKHSMRSGRLSRLSASRSSSSAATRRSRFCSETSVSESSASSAFCGRQLREPPLLAPRRRSHLDARAAQLGEELLERLESRWRRGDDQLRRDRRRVRRSTRGRTPRAPSSRVLALRRSRGGSRERSIIWPPRSGKTCTAARSPSTRRRSRRSCRSSARSTPWRSARSLDREAAGCGSARRPRTAPRPPPRASAARARRGSCASSPERNSITPVDDLRVRLLRDVAHARRVTALDVVVEARNARVAPGLRALARAERKTRFSTSSVSRTFFAFAYGPK